MNKIQLKKLIILGLLAKHLNLKYRHSNIPSSLFEIDDNVLLYKNKELCKFEKSYMIFENHVNLIEFLNDYREYERTL